MKRQKQDIIVLELVFRNDNSRKIILFGSCSKGEDHLNSDYDLFVVSDECDKNEVMKIISEYEIDREIKPVIVDEIELIDMANNEPVFYNEIMKGIELWEVSNIMTKTLIDPAVLQQGIEQGIEQGISIGIDKTISIIQDIQRGILDEVVIQKYQITNEQLNAIKEQLRVR